MIVAHHKQKMVENKEKPIVLYWFRNSFPVQWKHLSPTTICKSCVILRNCDDEYYTLIIVKKSTNQNYGERELNFVDVLNLLIVKNNAA